MSAPRKDPHHDHELELVKVRLAFSEALGAYLESYRAARMIDHQLQADQMNRRIASILEQSGLYPSHYTIVLRDNNTTLCIYREESGLKEIFDLDHLTRCSTWPRPTTSRSLSVHKDPSLV